MKRSLKLLIKKYSAEKMFFCNWMELCGYLVICKDNALDKPVKQIPIETTGLLIGHSHNRIVLEITKDLLDKSEKITLYKILLKIMNFIDEIEKEKKDLYNDYQDDRSAVIEKVVALYVTEEIYLFLHSLLRKAQDFLNCISWHESTELIKKYDELLRKMKMFHYQDILYLIKSHIL